jgi:hypothetical protein
MSPSSSCLSTLPAAFLFFLPPFLSLSSSSLLTLPVSLHNLSSFSPVSHLFYACLPIVAIPLLFLSPYSSCLPLFSFLPPSLSPFSYFLPTLSFCLLFLSTFASYLAPLPISLLFLFHFSYPFPLFLFSSLYVCSTYASRFLPVLVLLLLLSLSFYSLIFLSFFPPRLNLFLFPSSFCFLFFLSPLPLFSPSSDVSLFFQSS